MYNYYLYNKLYEQVKERLERRVHEQAIKFLRRNSMTIDQQLWRTVKKRVHAQVQQQTTEQFFFYVWARTRHRIQSETRQQVVWYTNRYLKEKERA